MIEQEIIEGNKIIAEFMGWKQRPASDEWAGFWITFPDEKSKHDMLCESEYLRFHKSWDWLMLGYFKFYPLTFFNTKYEIRHGKYVRAIANEICYGSQNSQDAFMILTEAIRWYNEIESKD
jgi:hypothetical protein